MWSVVRVCHDLVVVDDLSRRLVPDELWALARPLIPRFDARPQGGGTAPIDDRAMFTAIVFVLTSRCAWRCLPPSFGVTVPTAHRRFTEWTRAELWSRLHQAVLDDLADQSVIDWSCAILDGARVRATKGNHEQVEPGQSRQDRFEDPRTVHTRRDHGAGGPARRRSG